MTLTPESTERDGDAERTEYLFWMDILNSDQRRLNYEPGEIRDQLEIFSNPIVT